MALLTPREASPIGAAGGSVGEVDVSEPLWRPNPARVAEANLTAFMRLAAERSATPIPDFAALHRWSIAAPADFWSLLWDYAGVVAETRGEVVLADGDRMPGARFFPEARLNFAENLLRGRGQGTAIVFR